MCDYLRLINGNRFSEDLSVNMISITDKVAKENGIPLPKLVYMNSAIYKYLTEVAGTE